MGLFDFLKKQRTKDNISIQMHGYVNGKEVPLPKGNESDKVYSIDYYETLQREVKPLENKLVELAVAHQKLKMTNEKINSLTCLISVFDALKSKCYSLGPDFQEYFSQMWGHCHNSRNPDFCYIDQYKNELSELMSNREKLVADDMRYKKASRGLEQQVRQILQKNPHILQTEIYKHFDPIVKNDIRDILYLFEKDNVISRVKAGRTYEIFYNNR